ncbi:WG repeat-containing protein [Fibrivirga algicola]|uniref:WG repeat-containing protein n=1 Tax=Fibrivirga algicola TaxID=2950420 RepID=A0ABX0QDH4_9BACT|nr:WG repeat-containing protein [Fibrivirga algicola]NID10481.1 WG repeat-containing protein [Fibrivirga algicola]
MTLDELRERIKNELVLNEGNVADWQWSRTGLPAEANELGVPDFLRLVDDVSRPLNAQFVKILELQAVIRKVAADNQKRLSDVQIGGFALDAERLGLSRTFVIDQWVPRILAQVPDAPAAEASKPASSSSVSGTSATAATNKAESGTTSSPPPVEAGGAGAGVETADTMQQKVRDILDDYKEHIPAPAIRALFRAINYDEKALADAVLAYLTANFYASEKEPQGTTLREKLTSTDWRHLVWWDRPAQASASAASVPPASPAGPPAAAISGTSAPVAKKSSSGWRDFLVALLIAGGLIGFVMVLVKSNGRDSAAEKERERTQTEQAEARRADEEAQKRTQPKRKKRTKKKPEATQNTDTEATATAPVSPRYEPYDKLLSDVGQYGERPARKDGQWGLWRKGKWMILPVYDEISVYKEGRARVTVNGNSYDLDANGDRIR